jgi:hypothetical protein
MSWAVPFTRLSSDARVPTPERVPAGKVGWTRDRRTNSGLITINLRSSYFPAQNWVTQSFGQNRPVGGKLQGRAELDLTLVWAADSFL